MQTSDTMRACNCCGEYFDDSADARSSTCPACRQTYGQSPRPNVASAAVMLVVGSYTLLLSLFADWLGIGSKPGFGWQQWLGMLLAFVLVISGAVTRVTAILVMGLLIGGVTILADVLLLGDSSGFGWQQIAGSVVGAIMIGLGVVRGRRRLSNTTK